MFLAFLGAAAFAAGTVDTVDVGGSLDGFTQLGKKHDHIFCREAAFDDVPGDLCVFGKHGRITNPGFWSTAYVSDDDPRPLFVHRVEDPLGAALTDFAKLNTDFVANGYQVADNSRDETRFSVMMCSIEGGCYSNSIEMDAETGNTVLVIQRVK